MIWLILSLRSFRQLEPNIRNVVQLRAERHLCNLIRWLKKPLFRTVCSVATKRSLVTRTGYIWINTGITWMVRDGSNQYCLGCLLFLNNWPTPLTRGTVAPGLWPWLYAFTGYYCIRLSSIPRTTVN